MRRSSVLAAGFLALLHGMCALAQDPRAVTAPKSAGRAERFLSREELSSNCAGLAVAIKARIARLRELQTLARKEQQGPPSTLMAIFAQPPAARNFAKERERVEALNVALDAKGCSVVNVEEELQRPPLVLPTRNAKPKQR